MNKDRLQRVQKVLARVVARHRGVDYVCSVFIWPAFCHAINEYWSSDWLIDFTRLRCLASPILTSFRCNWVRAMWPFTRCLKPTVLYTDVDGQCDKLVTETVTSFEFVTVTIHLCWQHPRRSAVPKFKWFTWPNHAPFMGCFAIHGLALATVNLPTKFEVAVHPLVENRRF